MIEDNRVYEILTEICESVSHKRNKRGFIARCPVCGDSQKSKRIRRLHTDYYTKHNDWAITCYNGGCPFRSGNLYSLYATVKGITFREAKKYIDEDKYDSEKIIQALSGSKAPEEIEEIQVSQELSLHINDILFMNDEVPDDRIKRRYHTALIKFIKDRMIPEDYAIQMCVAHSGRYQGRVIIPIFIDRKLMYFQGRSLFDNVKPKYLNPDIDKSMIISNSDNFSRDKYIIVTEGIIDSWMVEDHQGTSVNGGYFSDELIDFLLTKTDKGVILVPDNITIDKGAKDTLEKFLKESRSAGKVGYFLMPGSRNKDLNNLRVSNPDLNIYEYIVENMIGKFATEMKMNLEGW